MNLQFDPNAPGAFIVNHTGSPERICASAAKISTTEGSALSIYDSTGDREKAAKLINRVIQSGHKSVMEHVNFTVAFNNVSVFVEQFIIEFRLAAYTVKSRRYVDFRGMGYHIPHFSSIAAGEEQKKRMEERYKSHMNYLFSEYEFLLDSGIPREDARFILPYSFRSNFYCTVNARELAHIIYSAIHGRGREYAEIREIGQMLLEQGEKLFPGVFQSLYSTEKGNEDKWEKIGQLLKGHESQKSECTEQCELLTYTAEPDETLAVAAIVNSVKLSTEEARKIIKSNPDMIKDCIQIAARDRRRRELEHITFTFRINKLSLAGLTHLVRHRMQSISIPSFSFIQADSGYLTPGTVAANPAILERYKNIWDNHRKMLKELIELGMPPEYRIYMCLSGDFLDVVTTMNARELFHFIQLRTCNRAQWEIKDITVDMLKKLKKAAPVTFSLAGPHCYMYNSCPEGKLACGKFKETVGFFSKI